jgi:outer membrane protein assembly factor BamB
MILAGGKLFTVHDYGFLYCSDARKGDFLWSIQDTDTPLELSYLNGVLYYLGAREGYFMRLMQIQEIIFGGFHHQTVT